MYYIIFIPVTVNFGFRPFWLKRQTSWSWNLSWSERAAGRNANLSGWQNPIQKSRVGSGRVGLLVPHVLFAPHCRCVCLCKGTECNRTEYLLSNVRLLVELLLQYNNAARVLCLLDFVTMYPASIPYRRLPCIDVTIKQTKT